MHAFDKHDDVDLDIPYRTAERYCNGCATFYSIEVPDHEDIETPAECPLCHGNDTEKDQADPWATA